MSETISPQVRTVWAYQVDDLDQLLLRLESCNGVRFDTTVLGWRQAQALLTEVRRLRAENAALRDWRERAATQPSLHELARLYAETATGECFEAVGEPVRADATGQWVERHLEE